MQLKQKKFEDESNLTTMEFYSKNFFTFNYIILIIMPRF